MATKKRAPKKPAEDGTNTSARFWKCALQVNSRAYSKKYRGTDHGLDAQGYLNGLLRESQQAGIKLLGVADHGDVSAVTEIRDFLKPHGIVVLPGFEIATTEKVHWVCLFHETTNTEQLGRYLGKLDLLDPEDGIRPSRLGGAALLKEVAELHGFCFAAHVTSTNGLLVQKFSHLWKDPLLVAAQIAATPDEIQPAYRQIILNNDPAYHRDRPLALINAKDVAKPEDLREARASTFIKMTTPGFDALCLAFKDPGSRVRLQGEVEEQNYSTIDRVTIDAGYLEGVDIQFSPHLNSVIGGRGTGKSTLLECLRYGLDLPHKGRDAQAHGESIVRENLGKQHGRVEICIRSSRQGLKSYRLVRRYGEPLRVIDEFDNESKLTRDDLLPGVEIYGQNEIFDLARDAAGLSRLLDRFLPERRDHTTHLQVVQRRLRENATRMEAAHLQREELEAELLRLPRLREQVKQFDSLGFKEKLKLVPLLAREKELPARAQDELERLREAVDALKDAAPDLTFLSDKAIAELPHAETIIKMRGVLSDLARLIEGDAKDLVKETKKAQTKLSSLISELDSARRVAEDKIEKGFATLPSSAGRDGKAVGRTYQALQQQIEAIRPKQAKTETIAQLVQSLEQARANLLGEMSDVRTLRTQALVKATRSLNTRLAGQVRLTVVPNGTRESLREFLLAIPGFGERSLEWLDDAPDLTIPALADACRSGRSDTLVKQWHIPKAKADRLCELARAELLQMEAIDLDDRVTLELNVAHGGEVFRPLERLSTGQQCTAILQLLLLDNPDPLIMDQPEDNLDNAFIADRIVRELRQAKTKRQFIFATHNANIPVFGDAEWIGVLEADEAHGRLPEANQGSIDVPAIRDAAATILDGGREAFRQRQEKYGY